MPLGGAIKISKRWLINIFCIGKIFFGRHKEYAKMTLKDNAYYLGE